MSKDVRKAIKIAASFSGVALGWYLFMPNPAWMVVTGEYRSQAAIHAIQLVEAFRRLRYQLSTPRSVREWHGCALKAGSNYLEAMLPEGAEVISKGFHGLDIEQYRIKICGPKPNS